VRRRWWAVIGGAGLAVLLAGACGLLLTRHGTPGLRPAPAAAAVAASAPAAAAGAGPTSAAASSAAASSAAASSAAASSAASGPAAAFPTPTSPIVAAPQSAQPEPAAAPVALTIPQIGVRTQLITLGLTKQGTVQVPSTTKVAGWYTGSPRPGATGPAIILGHIDSVKGPGVFFRLPVLRPGDLVDVQRSDHSTVAFRVTAVQTYSKDHFPTQAVYGATPDAELRLITCGGAFDSATGHYLSNIVVYATETS
jgi:sortase (surface protein transpeptidase)